ncbi:hypothetical protein PMAYCL1PPCAC_13314, partial [Pristionchus mayeri]
MRSLLVIGTLLLSSSAQYLPPSTGRCFLSPDPGPCRGFKHSFFYNSSIAKCESFVYGGCMGNDNRFGKLKHCTAACQGARPHGKKYAQWP